MTEIWRLAHYRTYLLLHFHSLSIGKRLSAFVTSSQPGWFWLNSVSHCRKWRKFSHITSHGKRHPTSACVPVGSATCINWVNPWRCSACTPLSTDSTNSQYWMLDGMGALSDHKYSFGAIVDNTALMPSADRCVNDIGLPIDPPQQIGHVSQS
jgi:hypothetical protein